MLSKYLSSKISIQRIKVTNSTATIPTAVAITAHYLHLVIFDASPMILPYKLMHPTKKKNSIFKSHLARIIFDRLSMQEILQILEK